MNYELAKELKEAGFPFRDCREDDHQPRDHEHYPEIPFCYPTLSDLIEACGEQFLGLRYEGKDAGWSVASPEMNGGIIIKRNASKEEAVAKLWLALNEPRRHHLQDDHRFFAKEDEPKVISKNAEPTLPE